MAEQDFIEHIFQRATEEFDIEFNPVAWDRMEKKLNRVRRRRALFFWLQWAGLLLLAALIGLLFWLQHQKTDTKSYIKKPAPPVATAPVQSSEEPCIETTIASIEMDRSKPTQNVIKKPFDITSENPMLPKSAKKRAINHASAIIKKGAQIGGMAMQKSELQPAPGAPNIFNNETTTISNSNIYNTLEKIDQIVSSPLLSETSQEPEIALSEQPIVESNIKPSDRSWSHWTIGISAAPEAVSVGFDTDLMQGYSIGILTEYRFVRRFSLSAQGFYSNKHYSASTGEFAPPRGAWANGIAPLETIGECSMLEARLALRTELLQKQKWNLVATTGVSSWWMLQEKYDYDFPDPTPDRYWQSTNTSTFWWAMAQVGLGVEMKLTKHLSIQADLYSQIPLKGVGRGKTQLYSQGLAFSLRRSF